MKPTYHPWRWLGPVALVITITLVSGRSQVAVPSLGLFSHDKLAHFLVFGLLATAVLRSLPTHWQTATRLLLAAGLVSIFGALDEWHQSTTPGRVPEYADWVADTLGAIVAVLVYHYWPRYRRTLEWSIIPFKRPHTCCKHV